MINLIPVLLLNTLTPNTNGNGYNYTTTYRLMANFNTLNIMRGSGQSSQNLCNNGYFYLEGRCYLNNISSYQFNVDTFGFNIHYYDESTDLDYSTSGVNDDTNGFFFDTRDYSLDFSTSIDYSAVTNNFYVALNTSNSTGIYATGLLDSDYFNDYIYDLPLIETMTISNTWTIDFQNDSNVVDSFERSIQNAIIASELPSAAAYNEGYSMGYSNGYDTGNTEGYQSGYSEGYETGNNDGYQVGYGEGYTDGEETDSQINAIYTGILSIGFIPINFFLAIFNFEILGINLSAFVSSILSVCVVIIIVKRVFSTEGGN